LITELLKPLLICQYNQPRLLYPPHSCTCQSDCLNWHKTLFWLNYFFS